MKIPSIKNKDYVTVWGKIPEENADFGYLLKKCTSAEAADSVELWYGEKDSWVFCNKVFLGFLSHKNKTQSVRVITN